MRRRCWMICSGMVGWDGAKHQNRDHPLQRDAHTWSHEKSAASPLIALSVLRYSRVQNTHHKFMRASYMKHFAKFLAILHHNASFFNFCFIINFGFNKNLLHIFEILKNYCCLCLRSLYSWLSLPRVVRFSIIFGSPQMQIICYYNAWLGKCLLKSQ